MISENIDLLEEVIEVDYASAKEAAYTALDDSDEFITVTETQYQERWGQGTFGEHELKDRMAIILDNFHDYIMQHNSLVDNKELYKLAKLIEICLGDLYTNIGIGNEE